MYLLKQTLKAGLGIKNSQGWASTRLQRGPVACGIAEVLACVKAEVTQ